ncbi:Gfo/Idh/MocA family oxidoreductase [Aliarcobacter butzleri]|uniref:Gfo/Idh/MocA family protein n=1 Tax=Aliarcobacter butzleri TaxID=28197 RepID=UPI001EDBBFAE|nr:Gfo/Idh/MocA family oxidoreductase [Aliarcobacter butzleri]MCG3710621.1 Gfo/Idh/MocA family oxidoreductase [Aliarcobacter butzleri]MCG3714118.1 Gfo/Idh/MocA family oxidoreductase [Aliarcobacter butzleri]
MLNYKKPLKLAFIGGGIDSAIGYTHYIASQMDHLFSVSAGCFSRKEDINQKTALTWGVEKNHLYSNWEALLENEIKHVDAVVILTPTPNHYEMIMKALDLGYSIISEKALATTYQEGLEITKKVEEKKAFFAVTHNYTGYPMFRELQDMIQNDKLGKITNINIEMPQESFARLVNGSKPTPQSWRLNDGKIPGVSLDLGAHLQHMIYFLTQENPIELVADETSFGWFPQVIDSISCIARYESGMRSQMWYGKSAIGHRNGLRVRVYGTTGSAEWFQMNPEELNFYDINGGRMIIDRASSNINIANQSRYNRFKAGHPVGFIEAFGNLYFDIAQKLRQYKIDGNHKIDWSYNAMQATIGLDVFESIQLSSHHNKWIKINSTEQIKEKNEK